MILIAVGGAYAVLSLMWVLLCRFSAGQSRIEENELRRMEEMKRNQQSARPGAHETVSRKLYEQVLFENDIMRGQLAEIGKSLGEKMNDVVVVKGKTTNADMIRRMTDAELEEALSKEICVLTGRAAEEYAPPEGECPQDCVICLHEWLKTEAGK